MNNSDFENANQSQADEQIVPEEAVETMGEVAAEVHTQKSSAGLISLICGVASLILGCCSCCLAMAGVASIALAVISVVFAIKGMKDTGASKGMAIAGLIVGIVGAVLGLSNVAYAIISMIFGFGTNILSIFAQM